MIAAAFRRHDSARFFIEFTSSLQHGILSIRSNKMSFLVQNGLQTTAFGHVRRAVFKVFPTRRRWLQIKKSARKRHGPATVCYTPPRLVAVVALIQL